MKLIEAVRKCKVRGYISRDSKPTEKHWKNVEHPFYTIVKLDDISATDWNTHDPEGDETSIQA